MITLKQNLRKELAYAIVDSWSINEDGKQRILDAYFNHGRCPRIACSILTDESYGVLSKCADKTFLALQNLILDELAIALDDWLDVFKIMFYEDFLRLENKSKSRSLKYGS